MRPAAAAGYGARPTWGPEAAPPTVLAGADVYSFRVVPQRVTPVRAGPAPRQAFCVGTQAHAAHGGPPPDPLPGSCEP